VPATLTRTPPLKFPQRNQLRLEPIRRRRRPLLAIGSLVVIAMSITVFGSIYARAGHHASVLAVAQPIAQGQTLSTSDLKVVKISVDSGLSVLPASVADTVVGRRVTEDLSPGTLLAPQDVLSSSAPPNGQAIVGVELKSGQLPASGIYPGESVDVVMTGSPGSPDTASSAVPIGQSVTGAQEGPGTILAPDVRVTDVATPSANSGSDALVVSLLVPRSISPSVASASAAGQAALVVVAPS
jgi:SAF domain